MALNSYMGEVRFKLKEYLAAHDISAYRLAETVKGISPITVKKYASGTRSPTLDSLALVMDALKKLTGKPIQISDVLEYQD